ncbi:MAG: FGGY-family carbohydrate kinase [Ignavibacteriaceae bacterium]
MNYMGVDIGTSCCKAVVFDSNGQQLVIANREYDIIFSDGSGAELNSDEVIEKCFEVIKECSLNVEPNSIKGLGITSQGEAFTAIGFNDETLCHAMVSSDLRSQPYLNKFLEKFSEEKLYKITGHTAHPMFTLFKLLWFKDNSPDLWKRTKYFLCFEDLLQFRLGIEPKISWSLAGRTMLFDVRKHQWNSEILNEIELSQVQLAKPTPSGKVIGKVNTKIASNLGLSNDTFVVTGGHDQPCSALGAGVTKEGISMYATGTVECITPIFKSPIFSEELKSNNLCTYDYTIKDVYTTVAFNLTGGNILKWFRDEFGAVEVAKAKLDGIDAYDLLLNAAGTKPSSLLVLPYFTPSGTPYFDTKTKGAIFGLQLSTHRGEFIRALLEGVSFEMRLNLEILENSGYKITELRAVGGGAKSAIWTQLKANVMNKKITALNIKEAGCFGAAMLACAADQKRDISELANKWVKPLSTVYPHPGNKKWYDERFDIYRKLYKTVKEISL